MISGEECKFFKFNVFCLWDLRICDFLFEDEIIQSTQSMFTEQTDVLPPPPEKTAEVQDADEENVEETAVES